MLGQDFPSGEVMIGKLSRQYVAQKDERERKAKEGQERLAKARRVSAERRKQIAEAKHALEKVIMSRRRKADAGLQPNQGTDQ